MTETLLAPPPVNETVARNAELLRGAYNGQFMEQAYMSALELDPRLEQVDIIPLLDGSLSQGASWAAWETESGRHEVYLRLYGSEATRRIDEAMFQIPGAKELFANKVGVATDQLTPEVFNVFVAMHELGHTSDYLDHENDHEAYDERNRQEHAALPLGGVATATLMNPRSEFHASLKAQLESADNPYGVTTMDELYGLQHTAYRNKSDEQFADNFASSVMAANPDLVHELTANVESYRNLPPPPVPEFSPY